MDFQQIILGSAIGTIITLGVLLNNCSDDKSILQTSVTTQNNAIENNRVDYEKKLKEYKDKKPKTVYIPKYVNVKRGDCDDIKNLLDAIDTNSF